MTNGFELEVLDRLTVEWLLDQLSDEERDFLTLWVAEDLNFRMIGKLIGLKYRGYELSDSGARYLRDELKAKCQRLLSEAR